MMAGLNWIAFTMAILIQGSGAIALLTDISDADLELSEINKRLSLKKELLQVLELKKQNFSEVLSGIDEEISKSESYQRVLEIKIQKEKDKLLQQEFLSEAAKQRLQYMMLQIKRRLRQSYLDENAGILPAFLGIESFENYMLRRYFSKKIALKNVEILRTTHIAAQLYQEQKNQTDLALTQLENSRALLRKQTQTLISVQQERRQAVQKIAKERALTQQQVKQLTERYQNLSQVMRDLTSQSVFKEKNNSILKWKGLLDWPAAGNIFLSYGQKNAAGFFVPLQGIFVQGREGHLVRSVFRGKIVFAGFMKGFGRTIIIDHGNAVHSVYAHLNRFAVTFGGLVSKGQTIGYMGDTESTVGVQLYFELRQNGIPQDPKKWLR